MKLAVVLFNLGGPDSLDAVEPFLRNLFSDPAIISLPGIVRRPLARWIAKRRAPLARGVYEKMGGRSPLLAETQDQARALETALQKTGMEARVFIAMRCSKPFSDETTRAVKDWGPERIVLLPLYPQYSVTTSRSSFLDWARAAAEIGLRTGQTRICCYPLADGFVEALADLIRETLDKAKAGLSYRLLLSAHGLPKRVIAKGDPYQWQVERTAKSVVERLGIKELDWTICYQSRVGPLEWIGPATEAEVRRAGAAGKGIVMAPIAFVSEHAETLVELDIDYAHLAGASGAPDYLRVPTVRTAAPFIDGLAALVLRAAKEPDGKTISCAGGRLCPAAAAQCGYS